jgi:hypothetical protein
MIEIEVRIKQSIDNVSVEHEYRAKLPDAATPEQIAAVGHEAVESIKASEEPPAEQGSIHIGKPRGVI